MTEHYDVVIVGSGAAVARWPLRWPRPASGSCCSNGGFLPREMDNWDPGSVFVDGKYVSQGTWYDSDGKPFQPQVHYFVGGATTLELDNLYVVDTSFFSSIGAVNPALTAIRVGDHLLSRMT